MTGIATMTRVEYRIEPSPYHENETTHIAEFLARLNELGKEGWQLVAMNPLQRTTGGWVPERPTPMLLMRVVTG
jgi:hypothetical protein